MIFFLLMFKDFFVEERRILSSKNRKMNFLFSCCLKTFFFKNNEFGVLKNRKSFFMFKDFFR